MVQFDFCHWLWTDDWHFLSILFHVFYTAIVLCTHAVSEIKVTVSSVGLLLVKTCQVWNNCMRIYPSSTATLFQSNHSLFHWVFVYYGFFDCTVEMSCCCIKHDGSASSNRIEYEWNPSYHNCSYPFDFSFIVSYFSFKTQLLHFFSCEPGS